MAKHEFGIMQNAPQPGRLYEQYEPLKYNCITVEDSCVEGIVVDLLNVDLYWHTIDRPAKGIAYTGITLIPPTAMQAFIDVIQPFAPLKELELLLKKALSENKWVIHFGL